MWTKNLSKSTSFIGMKPVETIENHDPSPGLENSKGREPSPRIPDATKTRRPSFESMLLFLAKTTCESSGLIERYSMHRYITNKAKALSHTQVGGGTGHSH
jgi:hypothetical protein